MFDDVLKQYAGKRSEPNGASTDDGDALDDLGSFGWLRGVRERAIMLEVRHKDGKVSAFGYSWLESAEFDPSEGITLSFSGKTVKIAGRNLNAEVRPNIRLFAGIVRHRVPWIQEADEPTAMEAREDTVIIEEVKVK